jgi:two-component system, NtrC family, response regulator AtoC
VSDDNETVATVPLTHPAGPGDLVLVAISGDRATPYRLAGRGPFVVGRSRDADVRIDDPSISRRHVRICVGERLEVEDLGGTNGTRVRNRALGNGEKVEVAIGEVIDAGSVLLVLQRGAAERPATSSRAAPGDAMTRLHALVERIAVGTLPVLIAGETGAGKEVLAEEIHRRSPRAKGPFVRINCAAVAETLLESELFGHEKGAFTGAGQTKPGLIETAHGGTLLLDEVGELPLPLQAKLLRVIEQREVMRVGALKPRTVDVRFLSATHRDLAVDVVAGDFRRDLYFRLNGITLRVPPLRERRSEIVALARLFVEATCKGLGRKPLRVNDAAQAALTAHGWPGNVRELRNVVERAVLLCAGDRIDPEHLVFDETPGAAALVDEDPERARILEALSKCGGNQTRAAKLLGLSRRTLTNRLNAFALPRPRK